jgi:hypothetical protein
MRINSLKTLGLILSLSKDEAKLSGFFGSLLKGRNWERICERTHEIEIAAASTKRQQARPAAS